MEHERDSCRGELVPLTRDLGRKLGRQFAIHLGEIDAGLFEDSAAGQHSRASATATFALPDIFTEMFATVQAFKGSTDLPLQGLEVGGRLAATLLLQ